LQADEWVVDDETGKLVDTDELRECYEAYAGVLELFQDLERGIMVMTMADYHAMPAVTLDAYRIFKQELQVWRDKHKMPGYNMN